MGSKTKRITYNVKERGRKYRGQDRNFDTAALADLINGGEVQERVKHRDMTGYYGHWPRVKFGMNPSEGGILDGKQISIEPAIVTTYLKALPDGTIEHESEFLDTGPGKLAERMFMSNVGGFSSAIDSRKAGDKSIPIGFYGFDFVNEPNFTRNRGFEVALDSLNSDQLLIMDECADYEAMFDAINKLYDQAQSAYEMQADALLRLQAENEALMLMIASSKPKKPEFDGIMGESFGGGEQRFVNADAFKSMELPGYEAPPKPKKEPGPGEDGIAKAKRALNRTLR